MSLCPIESYYDTPAYQIETLFQSGMPLMILLVPPAICYVLWKVFVTNRTEPRGGVCVLGLTETSATHAEMYGRGIAWKMLALYVATSFMTFNLGLMAFDFYYYVTGLLSSLFD